MKNLMPFLLILLFSCSFHKKQNPLVNTKWECKFFDNCVSYIIFKEDSTYEDYNCERDFTFEGKYYVKNDTIVLVEIDFPDVDLGNNIKIVKGRSTYIYSKEYLLYLSYEPYDNDVNKWISPNIVKQKFVYNRVRE